jgi:glycosyltransferase involved in cell wall biosynthesis
MIEPKLSIVMPVYNEGRTLAEVLHLVFTSVPEVMEVIAVDDGSKDNSREILTVYAKTESRLKLIFQKVNSGKTAALRTGIAATIGNVVIIQDADLEYDPKDINKLIQVFCEKDVDAVYGSRFMNRGLQGSHYSQHYMANKTLTFLSNLCNGLKLTDVETCYKAVKGDLIRAMPIFSKRFGFEIEVTAYLGKKKARVVEVPVSYAGRSYDEGKKIGFKDGLMALWYILKFNLGR